MFSVTSSSFKNLIKVVTLLNKKHSPNTRLKLQPTLFIVFFFLSSCGSYIQLIDDDNTQLPLKQKLSQKLSCRENQSLATHAGEDNEILLDVFDKANLSIEEELIIAILQQMSVRPATTSPWARLQIGLYKNNEWIFHDYFNQSDSLSLWQGLYDLRARYKLKSMNYYLRLAEKLFPKTMEIGSPFANYLERYKEPLVTEGSSRAFFKAGQILKSGESLPSLKWARLPKILQTSSAIKPLRVPSFNSKTFSENQVQCNFDIDLYSSSVYLVRPDPGVNYNAVARNKGKDSFIFISSVELQNPKLVKGQKTLLEQRPSLRPVPICLVKTEENKLLLTSFKGRDPGQHIYNLLQYSISRASKSDDLEAYIAFPRHQFLYDPARMLYESSRGSNVNLDLFLKMDFPIYHTPKLGEVWAWGEFPNENHTLAIDDRSDAKLLCR
tara:strand:+ start:2621 stop:3937 length:1317 start_codon:yes stop_codon:yes gene_type:complete